MAINFNEQTLHVHESASPAALCRYCSMPIDSGINHRDNDQCLAALAAETQRLRMQLRQRTGAGRRSSED